MPLMEWYIALTGSIVIILAGLYMKFNVGATMLAGAVALGLLTGIPAAAFAHVAADGLGNRVTLTLAISVLLLGALGYILKATGALDILIDSLNAMITDLRLITAALPAFISLIAVPGGAILSAPLCGEAAGKLNLSPARQAVINIWFRHVFYLMMPLFPSLILAAELSGAGVGVFVLHNLPLTVIGLAAGYLLLFRGVSNTGRGGVSFSAETLARLFRSISPLLAILILVVFFDLYFPLALLAGIVVALTSYLPPGQRARALLNRLKTMILPGVKAQVVLVIAGIMVYKEMLLYTEVISELAAQFIALGLPVILLLAIIPFLVGLLTGENSASMAILIPIFMPLLPQSTVAWPAYLAFLYASSSLGHIISPAHPCFSLTKEYFNVDLKSIVRLSAPLIVILMIAAILLTVSFGYY